MPMLKSTPAAWDLVYEDPRTNARYLLSLPPDFLRDIQIAAKALDMSGAEFVRRAVSQALAEIIRANPAAARSFRGKLPGSEA